MAQRSLEAPAYPRRLHSIRASLVPAIVLAVFVPALVIAVLNGVSSIQSSIANAFDQMEATSILKESQINLWLEELLEESERITQDEELVLLVRQALPNSPFPTRRDAAVESLTELFDSQLAAQPRYDRILLFDEAKRLIVNRNAPDSGNHSIFPLPRVFDQTSILPPRFDPTAHHSAVVIFQPIFDRGVPLAILGVSAPIDQLHPLLTERAGLGETGETYLLDNYGALLTPSRFDGYPIGTTYVRSQGAASALSGTNGQGEYVDYRGENIVGDYRWLPNLNMALLTEQDRGEILEPAVRAIVASAIITIAFVIIAVLFGVYFVERQITAPLVQLSQSAQQIAEGNYQMQVDIQRADEIGVLANTFNLMSENINNRTLELMRANALAQESARLKSQFMSTMSHELRTPLNAILGFTGIMLQGMSGSIDERAKHMLERIAANGQRLLTLIDDVLNIAKIEAGRLELVQEPFDPRALANKLHTQLGSLADQRHLDFTVDVSPAVPAHLVGDEIRIAQIITNLLSNALKFTEKGFVTLAMDYQDKQWIVRVSDTGIGIPPHAHNLIFEAFRQLDGSSRRVYGGTGLGLAIVRNLVTIMNGTIRVDSQISKGSTFTVTLPLPAANETETPALSASMTA